MNMTDEQKQQAAAALKEGLQAGYEKSKDKSLAWWERALWVLLTGIAYLAASLLTSCSMSLTKLPDGTMSFSGAVAQPVTVERGK